MDQVRPTLVKHGATLGANSTIICGVTIGRYAFIGAGAVVTRDVPDHALVMGNPAKQAGWMCQCGEGLTKELTCEVCGKRYKKPKKVSPRRPPGLNKSVALCSMLFTLCQVTVSYVKSVPKGKKLTEPNEQPSLDSATGGRISSINWKPDLLSA